MSELSFEQMFEESSFKRLRTGEAVTGQVIGVKEDEIILSIAGSKSEGIITRSEFTNEPGVDLRTKVQVGDELEAKVLKVNDGEGLFLSSPHLPYIPARCFLQEASIGFLGVARCQILLKAGWLALQLYESSATHTAYLETQIFRSKVYDVERRNGEFDKQIPCSIKKMPPIECIWIISYGGNSCCNRGYSCIGYGIFRKNHRRRNRI